ncbi:MAG: PDZ domain-containing protein [Planctomycetales bacterium]|nr:PDZ domain-containing protein [Planctomycetales bacterium]
MARLDTEVRDLLEKFVCVRLVQMKGVDLSLFQFDSDLTWCAFLMNGDGAIYGRYGTKCGQGALAKVSIPGFRKALERALDLHSKWPAVRPALEKKKGSAPLWRFPEAIPAHNGKFGGAPGRRNCIHCHNVLGGERQSFFQQKKPLPDTMVWTYPQPETVGLEIEPDEGNRVKVVWPGSAADKAGVQVGDVIETMAGQPILSIADIQFILHNTPEKAEVALEVKRGGASAKATLSLSGPWRKEDISWRTTTWALRPGFRSDALSPEEKRALGFAPDKLALKLRGVGNNSPAKSAGFKQDDVLLSVNGLDAPWTETEFLAYLRQKCVAGSEVPVVLWRSGKRIQEKLPVP